MTPNKIKLLAVAISTILGTHIAPVYAFPTDIELSANTDVTLNGDNSTDSDTDNTSVYASSYLYSGNDWADANASANDQGWIYSNAYGYGADFDAMSTVTQSVTVTNDTGLDQFIDFTFTINFGSLSVYGFEYEPAFETGEYITASYMADIRLNDTSIWDSSAALTYDENGYSFTQSGASLANYDASNPEYYGWGEQTDTIGLGLIGAGESFTLDYIVKTHSFGQPGLIDDCDNGYGDYGEYGDGGEFLVFNTFVDDFDDGYGDYGEYGDGYGCLYSALDAYAQFGDPFDFGATPAFTDASFTQSTPVPEPSSFAIIGAGLAGLAFMRRRQEKTKKNLS
ncbi:hypothetical protein DS2_16549 [Catenovulum agarivorans DS-2]|uniref:Ice-binding protein C-terminal domain-containing protein n=1 Tax=Catenovulum agarivorans DS-2 TaxID=1328313 RepID=W7Q748_9ALTE|nr:PEP-CTERM sorting domain-containing protein [Catenovulum agarivorans]EWH08574.1 hypothetical protein DS2_16549 [Catenovulum agarivorans DS-2]